MDSILDTVKKTLGVELEYTGFDEEIILGINTSFMGLYQLGVGPTTAYSITGKVNVWTEFLGDKVDLQGVKSYICLKTRLLFDPPSTSFVIDAMTRQIAEIEWRLTTQAELTLPAAV